MPLCYDILWAKSQMSLSSQLQPLAADNWETRHVHGKYTELCPGVLKCEWP